MVTFLLSGMPSIHLFNPLVSVSLPSDSHNLISQKCRNFRLADMVTIMNGVCGSLSVFMSAKYLLTHDEDYLWTALALPLAGLMFDFFDGKVARWRNESSMLGQELDSLADLVCQKFPCLPLKYGSFTLPTDFIRSCSCPPRLHHRSPNLP